MTLNRVEALMLQLCDTDVTGRIVQDHLHTGGKRLRARLALSATAALGADPEQGIGWAAACELAHNATLVHDDIEDGDTTRRGHPTVWTLHGVPQAINAGDLLFMLPFLALEHINAEATLRWRLSQTLAARLGAVIRGQGREMALRATWHIDRAAYLDAITGKTSGLFALPVEGAACLAGHDPLALAKPFSTLGVIFQLQDDVLDLYGNKGREKPGSDLREGKISALVVEHLALCPNDKNWLVDILKAPRQNTSQTDVDAAIKRFADSGALASVLRQIHQMVQATQQGAPAPLKDLLADILDLILQPIAHLQQ